MGISTKYSDTVTPFDYYPNPIKTIVLPDEVS